jgi:hypothetical protein
MRCCSIARRYPERFVDNTSKSSGFRQEEDSDLDRGVLISAVALLIAGLWIALFAPKIGREWDILNVSCLEIGFFGGKNTMRSEPPLLTFPKLDFCLIAIFNA